MGRPKTQIPKICITCGEEFMAKPSQTNHYKNAGSYCSAACSHKFTFTCLGCNKISNTGYVSHQKYCDKKCQYAARASDPIRKKAFTMSSFITFGGRGKLEYFDKWLRETLETPCKYCGTVLTLKNVSLDHIQPFSSTAARKDPAIKKELDKIDNLQIVCRPCNQMKGILSHDDYVKLREFLSKNANIEKYVNKKLAQSNIMWTHKRNAKTG